MGKNDGDYECRVASSPALGTKQRVRQQQHLIRFQITTFNTTTMGTNSTEYGAVVLLLLHSSRP